MKLINFTIISLFFTYCFAELKGNSFCSGGVYYRWDYKSNCVCLPGSCPSPLSNQVEVLSAQKALEAGEKCYKQFNNNEVCRKKCIETFAQDCSGRAVKTLYKENNGFNNVFCREKVGLSNDCL